MDGPSRSLGLMIIIFLINLNANHVSSIFPADLIFPLEDLVDDAVNRYHSDDWSGTINLFEKALVSYKMHQHVDIACSAKCKNGNISKELGIDFDGFNGLNHFGNLIAKANCMKLCIEEHPYGASHFEIVKQDIEEDFQKKAPYNFLQFAYFKMDMVKKACQAAQTYYIANHEDQQALNNIKYYQSLDNVDETYFKDLEAPKFVDFFLEGVKAYENKKYNQAVSKIELSLVKYFSAYNECQSLCFKPIAHTTFYRLYKAIALQLLEEIDCALNCENQLNPVLNGAKVEHFVLTCFSYLQFSYYSLENLGMAVPSAASAFLLNPEDETIQRNIDFYKSEVEKHGLSYVLYFQPRSDAFHFHNSLNVLKNLSSVGKTTFYNYDEEEVTEEVNDDIISVLTEQVSQLISQKLQDERE